MGDGSGSNSHDFYEEDSSGDETEITHFDKEEWYSDVDSYDYPEIVEETTEEIYIKEDNVDIQENFAAFILSPRIT